MTPQVSNFIPGSLEDTDNKNYVTEKQKGKVQIKMCNNNGNSFIATLHKLLLVLDICDRLFSIIRCMNYGHTCLFHKVFCTVYFGAEKKNAVTLPHSAKRKHAFLVKIKDMSKKNKLPAVTITEILSSQHYTTYF